MNIYLDIDGVLLKKNGTLANHFAEFLEFFVENHNVYWLTTHCRGGECDAIDHITTKNKITEKSLEHLKKIKLTDWSNLKTDAIDFTNDFVWFDDYVMSGERKVLLEENAFFRLHEINLRDKPDQLANMIDIDYGESSWCWQKMDLEISFSEDEFEMIKKGFHSDKGMDERWRFEFQDDTLYIMRHWTAWINYKLKFRFAKGKYTSTDVYMSNLVSQQKTGDATPAEKNWNGVFIIWLIEHYLLHNNRDMLTTNWYQLYLKIPIDSIHGYNHWKNVEKIGHYLAEQNGADKKVISAFAFSHDIGRTVEYEEHGHGAKSAGIIKKYFNAGDFDLNGDQYEKLLEAVSQHDITDAKSSDLTVQTCWDADRLDLPRVYIFPDKNFLYTEAGKSQETFEHLKIV